MAMTESLGEGGDPETQSFTPSPVDPDAAPEYLDARRRLLGPIADITHPEFGRDNTPAETFRYESYVECPNKFAIYTTPRVYDSNGNQLNSETLKLEPFNDGLQTDEPARDWIEVAES